MTNGEDCAFPFDDVGPHNGLSKREYFAAMALPGALQVCANYSEADMGSVAKMCVRLAEALIKELNQFQPTE